MAWNRRALGVFAAAALAVMANDSHESCGFKTERAYQRAKTRRQMARASRRRNR